MIDRAVEQEMNKIIANYVTGEFEKAILISAHGIPDYCNDLNAMHDAEGCLYRRNPEIHASLSNQLWTTQKKHRTVLGLVPAWQRAEAFVTALGKWHQGLETLSEGRSWYQGEKGPIYITGSYALSGQLPPLIKITGLVSLSGTINIP